MNDMYEKVIDMAGEIDKYENKLKKMREELQLILSKSVLPEEKVDYVSIDVLYEIGFIAERALNYSEPQRKIIELNQANYDKQHDVIHVFIDPKSLCSGEEIYPGVIVRRDDVDGHIGGFVIMDFSKKKNFELKEMIPGYDFFKLIKEYSN